MKRFWLNESSGTSAKHDRSCGHRGHEYRVKQTVNSRGDISVIVTSPHAQAIICTDGPSGAPFRMVPPSISGLCNLATFSEALTAACEAVSAADAKHRHEEALKAEFVSSFRALPEVIE